MTDLPGHSTTSHDKSSSQASPTALSSRRLKAKANAVTKQQHSSYANTSDVELFTSLYIQLAVYRAFYIWLYLSLAILSATTVILSLLSDCPTLAFYLLELVINMAMM